MDVPSLMRRVAARPEDPWLRADLGEAFAFDGQTDNAIGELEVALPRLRGHRRRKASWLLRRLHRRRRMLRSRERVPALPAELRVQAIPAVAPRVALRVQAIPAEPAATEPLHAPPAEAPALLARVGWRAFQLAAAAGVSGLLGGVVYPQLIRPLFAG